MPSPPSTRFSRTAPSGRHSWLTIAREARENPELLTGAPHTTPFGRLDEVQAAKQLVLCCRPAELKEIDG